MLAVRCMCMHCCRAHSHFVNANITINANDYDYNNNQHECGNENLTRTPFRLESFATRWTRTLLPLPAVPSQ